jgi:hypothetical protein
MPDRYHRHLRAAVNARLCQVLGNFLQSFRDVVNRVRSENKNMFVPEKWFPHVVDNSDTGVWRPVTR